MGIFWGGGGVVCFRWYLLTVFYGLHYNVSRPERLVWEWQGISRINKINKLQARDSSRSSWPWFDDVAERSYGFTHRCKPGCEYNCKSHLTRIVRKTAPFLPHLCSIIKRFVSPKVALKTAINSSLPPCKREASRSLNNGIWRQWRWRINCNISFQISVLFFHTLML